MKKKCGKKMNNEGFSLVEVLVAVIILALVAGPVLMAFVMSARFNARARESQRVGVVAESVMEEFKGLSIRQARNGVAGYSLRSDNPAAYEFAKTVSVDDVNYDVKITATPLRDKAAADRHGADTSLDRIVNTEAMNPYYDYVFTQNMYQDKTVYDLILNNVFTYLDEHHNFTSVYPGKSADNLDKDKISVDRVVKLEVYGDDSAQHVKVSYTYTYAINNYKITGHPDVSKSDFEPIVIDETNEIPIKDYKDLRRVYLFYSPGYKNSLARKVCQINNDTVSIVNNITGRGIEAYVVKQTNPLYENLTTLNNEYFPTVTASADVTLHSYAAKDDTFDGFASYTSADESLMYALKVEVFGDGADALGFPAERSLYILDGTINSKESDD
ncbi:MAG: type II secretion system GspH family protein [Lachnospiraceae bacterium]|nr:type II secretion system GspH family protein [Lachnospiraceae bacterium]